MNKYLLIFGLLAGLLITREPVQGALPGREAEKNFLPFENIYVHTDKDIYFAGDRLFYKMYLQSSPGQAGDIHSSVFYLGLADTTGRFVAQLELYAKNATYSGSILLPDTLATGIYSLAGWTNNMLIDRSAVFSRQVLLLNRFDEKVMGFVNSQRLFALEPDSMAAVEIIDLDAWKHPSRIFSAEKTHYRTREMVTLHPELSGLPESIASASITVTRAESLLQNVPGALSAGDDIPRSGQANSRQQAMIRLQQGLFPPEAFQAINQTITIKQPEFMIIPEGIGPVINGKVFERNSSAPVSNAVVFLSALDTVVNLKYSVSQSDGSFYFLLNEYHQGKELYLSVYNGQDDVSKYEIHLREKFVPRPFSANKVITHENIFGYLEEAMVFKRIQRAVSPVNYARVSITDPSASMPAPLVYFSPLHKIHTRDYVALDNFFEIGNEIVPNLRLRRRGDHVMASIVNPNNRSLLSGEPGFFFNGVYVSGVKSLADLPSEQIASVEVLSVPWLFGNIEFSGIVGVFSGEKQVPVPGRESYTIIQGNGLNGQQVMEYNESAVDRNRPASLPDFRETLLWIPEMPLHNGIPQPVSFYTSDLKGTFAAVVEGFDVTGRPFSQVIYIIVN
jgi:hypothetical protein